MTLEETDHLARELMDLHGLVDWGFKFNGYRSTIASCNYRDKTIKMSRYYPALATDEHIRMTILHEIAHAILPVEHGHDEVWKNKCIEIGGDGIRLPSYADNFVSKASLYAIQCSQGEIVGYVNSRTYNSKGRACADHLTTVRLITNPHLEVK